MLISQVYATGGGSELLEIFPAETPAIGDTLVCIVNTIAGTAGHSVTGDGVLEWVEATASYGGNAISIWVGSVTSTPASPKTKVQGVSGTIEVILAHFNNFVSLPIDQSGTTFAAAGQGDTNTGFPTLVPTVVDEYLIAACSCTGSLGDPTMPPGYQPFENTSSTFAAGYYLQGTLGPIDSSGFGWELSSGKADVVAVTLVSVYDPPSPIEMGVLTKSGNFGWAGGGKNGALVDMWAADRFVTQPSQGSPPPVGLPDAGPVTTGIEFGGPGAFTLVLPSVQDYFVRVQYADVTYWSSCPAGSIAGVDAVNGNLLATLEYTPSGGYVLSNTSLAAIDATNLVLSFTAPASGNVRLTWSAYVSDSTPVGTQLGVVFSGAGTAQTISISKPTEAVFQSRAVYDALVTGLTADAPYVFELAALVISGAVVIPILEPITGFVTAI